MIENNDQKEKRWFALYTKPRHEFKAQIQLDALSIENYLPTIIVEKKWSDRKKKVTDPLFRGYIFIHATESERLYSLQQKAIVKTISFNGQPATIPHWQIENIKIMLSRNPEVIITNKIEIGSSIEITKGPFSGVVGKVKEVNNEKWLIVTIDLLKRSVMVRLPIEEALQLEHK